MNGVAAHLHSRLALLPSFFPNVIQTEVRGRGLIKGIAFKNSEHPAKVVQLARERGVLLLTAGSDAVRFVPSLTVTREEVDVALDVIESSLALL